MDHVFTVDYKTWTHTVRVSEECWTDAEYINGNVGYARYIALKKIEKREPFYCVGTLKVHDVIVTSDDEILRRLEFLDWRDDAKSAAFNRLMFRHLNRFHADILGQFTRAPEFTRSRDAIKIIRPDDIDILVEYDPMGNARTYIANIFVNGVKYYTSPSLVTAEIAELYATFVAIRNLDYSEH